MCQQKKTTCLIPGLSPEFQAQDEKEVRKMRSESAKWNTYLFQPTENFLFANSSLQWEGGGGWEPES